MIERLLLELICASASSAYVELPDSYSGDSWARADFASAYLLVCGHLRTLS